MKGKQKRQEQTNAKNLYNDIEAQVDHPTVCGKDDVIIVVVVVLLLGWHTVYYYFYHDCHYCF
jgi:hypothetical protein